MPLTEKLSQHPELASKLAALSKDMLCVASVDGYFVSLNAQWQELLGYTLEELMSRPLVDFVHPDDREKTLTAMSQLSSGVVHDFENRFIDKAGTPHWLLWSSTFDTELQSYFAIAKDITERKRQELLFLRNHQLIETIEQIQTQFITDTDPRQVFDSLLNNLLQMTHSKYGFIGEVLYQEDGSPYLKSYAITNIAWSEETRAFYDENSPKGMVFYNLKSLFGEVILSGKAMIANNPTQHPKRAGIPDGHPPLNAFLGLPFFYGGKLIGMVGLANRAEGYDDELVDFLEPILGSCANMINSLRTDMLRRQAVKESENSSKMMRMILDSAVDGIITIDDLGIVQTFNKGAERIFGYADSEVIGQNVKILMPSPYRDMHDNYMKHYRDTGEQRVIGVGREVLGQRKDGSTFPLELAVSESQIDDQRIFTGIARDITERKAMERMKNEFVSTVSHELRTPLTSIRGSLGVVQAGIVGQLSEKGNKLINIAVNNCDRLIRLINDILDIEKMELGKMEFDFAKVEVLALIKRSIEANQAFALQHQVKIKLNARDENIWCKCDADRIDQVVTNLLSNGIKFSPAGGVVELYLAFELDRLVIEVTDQGEGVPVGFQSRLFEKFAMADSSDTRHVKGTGLGLSISQAIIERHGGNIRYIDRPDTGGCFRITLPAWQPLGD